MDNKKTQKGIASGVFWKFSERMAAQMVSVIVAIILARLLPTTDYGTISLVTIFITIANVFVSGGFGTALIQKKDADNTDFSTVFYFNIGFCAFLYLVIWFIAPLVSGFYDMPILIPVLRVLGIKVLISSVNSVQHAYVSRNMLFKRFFYSTLLGTIVSAFVGVSMAYSGFGVWSLVAQDLTNVAIDTLVLWCTVRWRPTLVFSYERLKSLFSFGWKILLQSFFVTIYGNLRSLIIGKVYSAEQLAFYTKGSYYPNLLIANVDSALNTALFPAMANNQEKKEDVRKIARYTMCVSSYLLSPLLIGFAAVANEFVIVVLTEKWLPIVPFIRIICCGLLLRPAQSAMLQAVKAVGKSDLVLKYDTPIRIIGIGLIVVAVKYGTIYIAVTEVVVAVIGVVLYSMACNKAIGYSLLEVAKDLSPNVLMAGVMGAIVYLFGYWIDLPQLLLLFLEVILGILVYLFVSIIFKNKNYIVLRNMLLNRINNKH